MNTDVRQGGGR